MRALSRSQSNAQRSHCAPTLSDTVLLSCPASRAPLCPLLRCCSWQHICRFSCRPTWLSGAAHPAGSSTRHWLWALCVRCEVQAPQTFGHQSQTFVGYPWVTQHFSQPWQTRSSRLWKPFKLAGINCVASAKMALRLGRIASIRKPRTIVPIRLKRLVRYGPEPGTFEVWRACSFEWFCHSCKFTGVLPPLKERKERWKALRNQQFKEPSLSQKPVPLIRLAGYVLEKHKTLVHVPGVAKSKTTCATCGRQCFFLAEEQKVQKPKFF